MTLGQFLAILISLAAMYATYAFVQTKHGKPTFPFNHIPLD